MKYFHFKKLFSFFRDVVISSREIPYLINNWLSQWVLHEKGCKNHYKREQKNRRISASNPVKDIIIINRIKIIFKNQHIFLAAVDPVYEANQDKSVDVSYPKYNS